MQSLQSKKREKSLRDILTQKLNIQNSEKHEEDTLIKKILDKKPELRNTTAKFLNKTILAEKQDILDEAALDESFTESFNRLAKSSFMNKTG